MTWLRLLGAFLWALSGYINGYNDCNDRKFTGAIYMATILIVLAIFFLLQGIE